jgi:hypothetical protein
MHLALLIFLKGFVSYVSPSQTYGGGRTGMVLHCKSLFFGISYLWLFIEDDFVTIRD